ncbi:MAG: FAD-dependent oxidoreductase [Actinobacteria bacterium]|nr:FAD-dependent oxidoreductase [Actinomycetota bacterium]
MNGEREMQADVVVIGCGASGLCAALTLSFGGASVLMVEQEPEPGGMTNYAEGMFAVGSRMQKKAKVGLTVEEAFNIHMEETHWLANPRLVRTFMDKTADTIDWLEAQGARFSGLFTISPLTQRVWHQMVGFGKEGLIEPLFAKAQKQKNIEILFETEVKSLLMEDGRAVGVVAKGKNGQAIQAKAKVVIIASGGYQDNQEWVDKYCKSGFTRPVVPARQVGSGASMAWQVGAEPYDMGVMQTIVLVPEEELTSQLLTAGFQPRLWVNKLGERFCNEAICWKFPMAGNALARQPGATAWCIFDDDTKLQMKKEGVSYVLGEFYDILKNLPDLDEELARGEEAGKVFRNATLEGLAAAIGVNQATLSETVAEYNGCCDKNYDPIFAKDRVYLQPIKKAPFYAVKLGLAAFMTNGGIRINHKTQVLKEDRSPIPGLYAIGCCAGGILGDTYEVSTTGGSLSFAVNTGRIAGESVLEDLGK